jgi:hypothetical protein
MSNEPLADGGWLDTGGVLSVATDEEAAQLNAVAGSRATSTPDERAKAKGAKVQEAYEADCDRVLALLPVEPASTTVSAVVPRLNAASVRGHDKEVKSILEYLASPTGGQRALDFSDGSRGKPRQWARPRQAADHESVREKIPLIPPASVGRRTLCTEPNVRAEGHVRKADVSNSSDAGLQDSCDHLYEIEERAAIEAEPTMEPEVE